MLDTTLSARHFTDSAQRAIRHTSERAFDRGMIAGEFTDSTSEMLAILSMLRWERKVGRATLERIVADCDALARELDNLIDEEGEKSRWPTGPRFETLESGQKVIVVDTDAPMQNLLGRAEHEALDLGHNWVGTEHLLLAAVRSTCPRLQELLARHGVRYDAAKKAILELLQS